MARGPKRLGALDVFCKTSLEPERRTVFAGERYGRSLQLVAVVFRIQQPADCFRQKHSVVGSEIEIFDICNTYCPTEPPSRSSRASALRTRTCPIIRFFRSRPILSPIGARSSPAAAG